MLPRAGRADGGRRSRSGCDRRPRARPPLREPPGVPRGPVRAPAVRRTPASVIAMSRRAKIVCTLGPATSSLEQITALVESGMDVARLNFSHGEHAHHATAYQRVREASDSTGHAVAVLADLQGPKIRLGTFADGPVEWPTGAQVCITVDDVPGTAERVSTTYKDLANDVVVGDRLLVDDGKLALTVVRVDGPDVFCLVVEGGPVSNNKGLSLPGVAVSVPRAVGQGRGGPALRPAPGRRLHRAVVRPLGQRRRAGARHHAAGGHLRPRHREAREARGGREPRGHRRGVRRDHGGPRRPRRGGRPGGGAAGAEARHPGRARAEQAGHRGHPDARVDDHELPADPRRGLRRRQRRPRRCRRGHAVRRDLGGRPPDRRRPHDGADHRRGRERHHRSRCRTSCAGPGPARARSCGRPRTSARRWTSRRWPRSRRPARRPSRLAALHPRQPLLAFTVDARVRSQLALSWGVETFLVPSVEHTDDMVAQVDFSLLSIGRLKVGDRVVVVAGSPPNTVGSTNLIRVHEVGTDS